MPYAAGLLIALLVLCASATAAFAACKDTEVPEIRYTDESRTQTHIVCVERSERETATPAPPSGATKEQPPEAPANQTADPFTGRYVGSWFDVSGTKGWRQPTEVVFKRSLPDLVTLDYTQGPGFGTDRTPPFSTVWIAHRDKNKIFHPRRNGDTIILTAEKNTILMERAKANGEVRVSGRLWRVPEDTPDIPAQLAPLKGVWSGRAKSDTYSRFGLDITMEIDVFPEGPHFVVAVDYRYDSLRGWDGRKWPGGRHAFINHLSREDLPEMWWGDMELILRESGVLFVQYQAGNERYPHTVSATLEREGPVSE